jgi:hypothetical protein
MEISCLFGREYFQAGGNVVVCLRNINVAAERDYVLLAQVCGYIHLDPKWSKSNDKTPSFVQTPIYPFDHSIQMPQKSVPNSYCIFLTPREVLSTTQINDSGVFLMFSLPIDLIPTYKGTYFFYHDKAAIMISALKWSFMIALLSFTSWNKTISVNYMLIIP